MKVRDGSPAERQGMQVSDVLVGLDRWEIVAKPDLNFVLEPARSKDADKIIHGIIPAEFKRPGVFFPEFILYFSNFFNYFMI